ncbi:transglutaminase-like cysteine peptidase [Stutzerimonas sp. R40042]|uniref:cysteine protease LapG n=1 Tax=Stutzerimonas TaxID=2901164 RepID=UPI002278E9D2|nr:transglutaminase-like cysteine peptidase [Stutzerimonas sp. R40042]WAE62333.1 transglutaminase-like cysteine peptidase [Stutzerimonas sp. R40042]
MFGQMRLAPFRYVIALLGALGLAQLVWAVADDWDFQRILDLAEKRYGSLGEGRERVLAWQQLLGEQGSAAEHDKLRAVNNFFNHQLRFEDDVRLWRQTDYWATPVEALRVGGGDCEDFAIAKYVTLRRLGVSADKLRITYVKAVRLNQAHMVLTYYEQPGAVPLVLDNLVGGILPATQRNDLVPVYAFNGEGLWLPGRSGDKQVSDSKKLSRWQDLLKKMQAEGFPAGSGS